MGNNSKQNKNQGSYYEAKKVSDELVRILNGESEQEPETLYEYFKHNKYGSEIKTKISDGELLDNEIRDFHKYDKGKDKERLLDSIREQHKKRKKRLRLLKLNMSISVAAALIAVCFLVIKYNGNLTIGADKAENAAEDITKPTLILSSGERVTILSDNGEVITDDYIAGYAKEHSVMKQQNPENQNEKELFNTLIIPSGYTHKIELSDGSVVTLNAGGRLIYPVLFKKELREVVLKGEAFFDIKKSDKPFIVNVNNVKIKVYGTSFNVKEFKSGNVETVLIEGSVGIKRENESETMIKPNQRIVLFYDGTNILEEVDTEIYTSWMKNSFRYHAAPLKQIFEDIEQWYGITINIENIKTDTTKIDLFVDRNILIEELFQIIEKTTDYLFINEGGGKYKINRKKI